MVVSPVIFVLVAFIASLICLTAFYAVQCGVERISSMTSAKQTGPSIQ